MKSIMLLVTGLGILSSSVAFSKMPDALVNKVVTLVENNKSEFCPKFKNTELCKQTLEHGNIGPALYVSSCYGWWISCTQEIGNLNENILPRSNPLKTRDDAKRHLSNYDLITACNFIGKVLPGLEAECLAPPPRPAGPAPTERPKRI